MQGLDPQRHRRGVASGRGGFQMRWKCGFRTARSVKPELKGEARNNRGHRRYDPADDPRSQPAVLRDPPGAAARLLPVRSAVHGDLASGAPLANERPRGVSRWARPARGLESGRAELRALSRARARRVTWAARSL